MTAQYTTDQTQVRTNEALEKGAENGRGLGATVAQGAETVADKARSVATDIRQTDPRELIDDAKSKADELGDKAATQTESVMHASGDRLTDLAETVRAKTPDTGLGSGLASSSADALERSGTYLQEADLADVRMDLEGMIRRHPIQALAVGLGLGYLVARAMRN
jgi:hypothetical protein